jgi:uncharacterized membrane protein YfcA
LTYVLLLAAAFGAGVINAVAGGGTFLTFPALLFAGVPPVAANATSTVALFPGQLASVFGYRRDLAGVHEVDVRVFGAISVCGGLAGALLLLFTPNTIFIRVVPWLMLFATVLFTIGNFSPAIQTARIRLGPRSVLVSQTLIAIYGGYFGGGIGFLMLAALTMFGMRDIHAMNGLKILLASMMNAVAVIAFIVAGAVHPREALVMAAGALVGGYAGARLAKLVDPRLVKLCVVAIGFGLTGYFFWRNG